jgi:hypothetical protein
LLVPLERALPLVDADEFPHALRSRVAPISRSATGAVSLARAVLLL